MNRKVYVVMRADSDGNLLPEAPVAIKLRHEDARAISVLPHVVPAKVLLYNVDKGTMLNGPEAYRDRRLLPWIDERLKPPR